MLRTAAALALAACLAACAPKIIEPFEKQELHRSAPQRLVIENEWSQPVALIGAEADVAEITIAPGEEADIGFVVVTLADREDDGSGIIEGSRFNRVVPARDDRYFSSAGEDWVLRFRVEDEVWEASFFLGECWFGAPATGAVHRFELEDEPLPGLPEQLCP